MPNLTVIAHIRTKSDQIDLVRTELEKLLAPTRAEDGCIRYEFHQDNEDPTRFLFYEEWASRAQWQVHMNNAHLKAYLEATDGAVEDFRLQEMTAL